MSVRERVLVPGRHAEPTCTKIQALDGTVWTRQSGKAAARGWQPAGEPDLELKWTSPAMEAAGPFILPGYATPAGVAKIARAAAHARWAT